LKVGIVGPEESKWKSKEQIENAKFEIRKILFINCFDGYGKKTGTLVSGHCPKGGVDIWAEEIADNLGIKKEIYPVEVNQWEDETEYWGETHDVTHILKGYKSRNIQIAKACDVLYDIESKGSCKHCDGFGYYRDYAITPNKECSYCKGTGNYSGGTWTYRKALEMGREAYQVVIE
jgi:hypothetical protein